MKFLFDFVVPKNLDSMLLKLCELILPTVNFQGCTVVWFYELHYREKNSQQCFVLYTEISYRPTLFFFLILWIHFLEPVAIN